MDQQELLPDLFRTEYSKLTAVLCKTFGLSNIELAEDIVGDTFLLAAETWGKKGVPENQTGWLYTVAKNKTRDHLRRKNVYSEKVMPGVTQQSELHENPEIDMSTANINDSQLQMLFAVCHPSVSSEAQIGLALRILCGFTIDEIAVAFLTNKETINKRLYRAKESWRKNNVAIEFPSEDQLPGRLDNVLRTLYLLFNEGYYSAVQDQALRKDLCLEAMRLTMLLTQNKATDRPEVNALLALTCFHASRFASRSNEDELVILYADQDRSQWDEALIEKGSQYLNRSSGGDALSKYHLEAAIAWWHTQKDDAEKWENILQLYNYLLQVEYSPMAALNRIYALSRANSLEQAIAEAEKINLSDNHFYHCLLAELYSTLDPDKAKSHLEKALRLAKSDRDRRVIEGKMGKTQSILFDRAATGPNNSTPRYTD